MNTSPTMNEKQMDRLDSEAREQRAASELAPSELQARSDRCSVADLFGDSERNWPEDFGSENGAYGHVCRDCGQSFVGHKRRPNQCRKCALVAKAKWDALTPEQQAEKEKAVMAWLKAHSPNIPQSATPGGQCPASPCGPSPGVAL